jgi:hypothetical protein
MVGGLVLSQLPTLFTTPGFIWRLITWGEFCAFSNHVNIS